MKKYGSNTEGEIIPDDGDQPVTALTDDEREALAHENAE